LLDEILRLDPSDYFRTRVLSARIDDPSLPRPYPRLVAGPDIAALQPPLVLATIHTGPMAALGAILQFLPKGEVALLLRHNRIPRRRARLLVVDDDESSRISAMAQAARILRSPGFVFMAIDAEGAKRVQVDVHGRTVSLACGAFALARMAQAPMVPIAVHWRGSRVQIVTGEPISPDVDSVMAAAFATWFEGYFSEHPKGLASLTLPLAARGL
jgi:lauroyl/myristoyl acyltransferase